LETEKQGPACADSPAFTGICYKDFFNLFPQEEAILHSKDFLLFSWL
jgi:hypothetical protein